MTDVPKGRVLRVAVPAPLHGLFDYLPPEDMPEQVPPGVRLRVPFGRKQCTGILVEYAPASEVDPARLKRARTLLDLEPALPPDVLAMLRWAARYYHHPLGDALSTALPALLRQGRAPDTGAAPGWTLTAAGRAIDPATLTRAPRQRAALEALQSADGPLAQRQLTEALGVSAEVLRTLAGRGWIERCALPAGQAATPPVTAPAPTPNAGQRAAVEAVTSHLDRFAAFLLDGITGSGKTEVYLQAAARVLEAGRQVLVIVPEIGLTPQLEARFRARFGARVAVLHSGLSDGERLRAWRDAGRGETGVLVGTRSAVFTPLARPGLFVVDEEHDASLKQQEGFRYSARDLLVWRARHLGIPVVLGSATPSLESLANARACRYRHLHLPERAGAARHPHMRLLDVRGQPMDDALSQPMLNAMAERLARGEQVLLFLNRRGYAPTLLCHDCGWVAECRRCDAHLTLHRREHHLTCHHCGSRRPLPAACEGCGGTELRAIGAGTERIEQALARRFPDETIVRIDRDSTRRKGKLAALLEQARRGDARILLGTQMLAKGHDFPGVTLVGILDTDQGLFSADFRAGERMAQLIVQVAGRAGRADKPGEVLIQTHHPEHPLLNLLVEKGYAAFAEAALAEREAAGLPPFAHLALLRAEATDTAAPLAFLEAARDRAAALAAEGVELWGPVPAPMERRAGRVRAQLMLQSRQRTTLHRLLNAWLPRLRALKEARRVRWSVDVDPADTF